MSWLKKNLRLFWPYWYDKRRLSVNHPGEIGQWQNGIFEVIDKGEKRTAPPILKPAWPKK